MNTSVPAMTGDVNAQEISSDYFACHNQNEKNEKKSSTFVVGLLCGNSFNRNCRERKKVVKPTVRLE